MKFAAPGRLIELETPIAAPNIAAATTNLFDISTDSSLQALRFVNIYLFALLLAMFGQTGGDE